MELNPEQYAKMVAYLEGRLNQEDELKFLEELLEDPVLQSEFDLELMIRAEAAAYQQDEIDTRKEALGPELDPADEHIRKVVAEAGKNLKKNRKKGLPALITQIWTPVSVAALLVLACSLLLYFLTTRPSGELVIEWDKSVFIPPAIEKMGKLPDTLSGSPDNGKRNLARRAFKQFHQRYQATENDPQRAGRVMMLYQDKKYREAAELARTDDFAVRGENQDDKKVMRYARFYRGLCYLELGEEARALAMLTRLSKELPANDPLEPECTWFTAMCFLAQENEAMARPLLEKAASDGKNNSYKTRAAKLLAFLDQP